MNQQLKTAGSCFVSVICLIHCTSESAVNQDETEVNERIGFVIRTVPFIVRRARATLRTEWLDEQYRRRGCAPAVYGLRRH